MQEHLDRLIHIIEQLISEYTLMLADSEQHRQALIEGKIDSINQAVGQIASRVRQISKLETMRQAVGEQLASTLQVDPATITASFLAERTDPVSAQRIQELSEQCKNTILQVQKINEQNRLLTEQSLSFVNEMVQLILDVKETVGYGNNGAKAPLQNSRHFFDMRA